MYTRVCSVEIPCLSVDIFKLVPNDFSPGLIEAPVLKLTKSNESAFLLINFGFDDYIWVFNIDGELLLVLFVATMVVFVPFYSI